MDERDQSSCGGFGPRRREQYRAHDELLSVQITSRKARAGLAYVEFGIVADPGSGGWRTDPHALSRGAEALKARVAEALPKLEVINPRQMFEYRCLCCGKELTDPASMARMIGPECAGTASLDAGLIAPASDISTGPGPDSA